MVRRTVFVPVLGLACLAVPALAQQVVNIDFNGDPTGGDQVYVGDDGALSSPGGTFWNGVDVGTSPTGLFDQFHVLTPVGVSMSPNAFGTTDPAATNDLQDSGVQDEFLITGLVPGELYTLVGYVGPIAGFNVTDASGPVGFQGYGDPTYNLPGVEGTDGDYFRFDNLQPYNLGGGVYGLLVQPEGLITGVQILGVVPTPSTIAITGLAGVAALGRRRRPQAS